MAQLVKVNIELEDGKRIDRCLSLTIEQDIFRHHRLELQIPFEALEKEEESFFRNSHKEVCGKSITVSFEPVLVRGEFDVRFKGIVTSITVSNVDDRSNIIIIRGYSPTILLDDRRSRRSFLDKSLQQVFDRILQAYPANIIRRRLRPQHFAPVKYLVQYDETPFEFLSRIAAGFGEWFFYDGEELILGEPAGAKEIAFDVSGNQTFDISIALRPIRFQLSGYDPTQDKQYSSRSNDQPVEGLNPFGRWALDESDHLFSQGGHLVADLPVQSQQELDELTLFRRSGLAGELVLFQGNGETPDIRPGSIIQISGARLGQPKRSKADLGSYRITEITHFVDRNGNYSNRFKAIPRSNKVPPLNPMVRQPVAGAELAVIKEVNDPDKLNRVKVEFQWAGADQESGWIRVGTFYSGGEQGGMQFLPEKGAQIIIGYERGNPTYPFMLTSLYPKKAGMHSMKGNNDEKLIYTKGGNLIELIDKKDENSIRITNLNKKETSILLEFRDDGKISLLTEGDIELSAGKSVSISANESIDISAGTDMTLQAENLTVKAKGKIDVQAVESIGMNAAIIKIN